MSAEDLIYFDWLIDYGLTSHWTHYRSYRARVLRVKWPNQQCQSTEGSSSPKDRLQSHQVHLTVLQYYTCMQYTVIQKIHTYTKMNLSTVKWTQWDKTQSRELLGLFICVCIALCTIVAHNIAQNRPDNFPSYPQDNHHCSNDVYLREGGGVNLLRKCDLSPLVFTSQRTDECFY